VRQIPSNRKQKEKRPPAPTWSEHAKIAQRAPGGSGPDSQDITRHVPASLHIEIRDAAGGVFWAISHVHRRFSFFPAEDPQQGFNHPAEKLRKFDGVKFHPYPSLPDVVDPTVIRSLIYMRNPPMCA